ncbi:MAG: NADP-dependent phosphogluconate dehydrogenase [Deltaproteobacteria bacterium]|nr:NADP-dependent phosphogluconate dehydrogenase [Deltaproteobacteria bacterium]
MEVGGTPQVGVVGLGRIGLGLVERLRKLECEVLAFDRDPDRTAVLGGVGARRADSLADVVDGTDRPRKVFLLVPAGAPVDTVVDELLRRLAPGDLVADLGNSHPGDSVRRWAACREREVRFLDVGLSGGVRGAREGPCLVVGGAEEDFRAVEPLFRRIAVPGGLFYAGPPGWGHTVKVIHNGIEYGFMQALGEGLHVLRTAAQRQGVSLDLAALCRVWATGSIISSRLVEDAATAIELVGGGAWASGAVGGGETGQWAARLAAEHGVPVPALNAALRARASSSEDPHFAVQLISAIRNVFGQHPPEAGRGE